MNILHITPHLGGGVGTVVLNWLKKEHELNTDSTHIVACLQENKNPMQQFLDMGLKIYSDVYKKRELLNDWIRNADIVLLHWWNHPLLFDIMVNYDFPESRLIIWNHVSALHPPYIHSGKLIDFSDSFVFTSPVSYEAKEIQELPDALKEKLDVVWSSCGTDIFEGFKKQEHAGFIVGLTGTVDYGKLHPDFIRMSAKVNIPDVRFIVCSGDSQEKIKQEAIALGIESKFDFMGRVPSIMPYLAVYDVFGYPLQPHHFGTCEQAIGEAMMAEVVPVVLNNPAEKYIIKNGETGIIANTQTEYVQAIEYLYRNPDIRKAMGVKARKAAEHQYSVINKMAAWDKIFAQLMQTPKHKRKWHTQMEDTKNGSAIFIESLGDYGKVFADYIHASKYLSKNDLIVCKKNIIDLFNSNTQWKSDNKGGVKQYLRAFHDDPYLKEWSELF